MEAGKGAAGTSIPADSLVSADLGLMGGTSSESGGGWVVPPVPLGNWALFGNFDVADGISEVRPDCS